jgi:hypothetical protein
MRSADCGTTDSCVFSFENKWILEMRCGAIRNIAPRRKSLFLLNVTWIADPIADLHFCEFLLSMNAEIAASASGVTPRRQVPPASTIP